MNIKVKKRFYIICDDEGNAEKIIGKGMIELLEAINESNSIREACYKLGLSYSKAIKMLSRYEKNMGMKILDRKRGGTDRSGSSLTKKAKDLIDIWHNFENDAESLLSNRVKELILSMENLKNDE